MNEHQTFERAWWGDCANTFTEERKQLVYAARLGLPANSDGGKFPVFDLAGKSVLDLGGGPVSLLLKAVGLERAAVVDPCPYPAWIDLRYANHGVEFIHSRAEDFETVEVFDEVWIYNVLQHVDDPKTVIETARRSGSLLRIFEWVEHPSSVGHPHVLHVHELNEWIGGGANGVVELLDEGDCQGIAYYGLFPITPAMA